MLCLKFLVCVCVFSSCRRIEAVFTSAPTALEGFKAHAVFQEIAKKLEEVRVLMRVSAKTHTLSS